MLKCFCENPMPLDCDDICATKCGHIYHEACLLQWLVEKHTCPDCRTPLTMTDKFKLYLSRSTECSEQEKSVNEALQTLDNTRSQLNEMLELCKKKDKIIEKLKNDCKRYNGFRQETEKLNNILQIFHGESLDFFFDDPEFFDSVLKGKKFLTASQSTVSPDTNASQNTTDLQRCLEQDVLRNIKRFRGSESQSARDKLRDASTMDVDKLKTLCEILCLASKVSQSELGERLAVFVTKPQQKSERLRPTKASRQSGSTSESDAESESETETEVRDLPSTEDNSGDFDGSSEQADAESAAIQFSLDTINNMISRISEVNLQN